PGRCTSRRWWRWRWSCCWSPPRSTWWHDCSFTDSPVPPARCGLGKAMAAVTATPTRRRSLTAASAGELRRRTVDRLATALISGAALVGCALLLFIVSYVVIRGAPAINLAFFTQAPRPMGEEGGGVLPAI